MKKILRFPSALSLMLIMFFGSTKDNVLLAHKHDDHSQQSTGFKAPPIAFIENKGQWDDGSNYRIGLPNGMMRLTKNGFIYNFVEQMPDLCEVPENNRKNLKFKGHTYKVNFVGSNASSNFKAEDKHPNYSNYFIGNDQSKWAGNVGHYSTVTQNEVYTGIDLKIYSNKSNIKYDFIVKSGANPQQIKLQFDGVSPILQKDGSLLIKTSVNEVIEQAPYTYQIINGKEVEVKSNYKLQNGNITFEFPNSYNNQYDLIIDPNLIFATYSGGGNNLSRAYWAHSTTYDNDGNTYASALTQSTDWPTTPGAFAVVPFGSTYQAAINKYSVNGSALVYSTYFGTTGGATQPTTLRVTNSNELVMAGTVTGTGLPVTTGAYQSTFGGGADLYIVKFNTAGSGLVACTYLGGSGMEGSELYSPTGSTTAFNTLGGSGTSAINPTEIAFDDQNNIWITSNSASNNYPVTPNAHQGTISGSHDVVVTKLNPTLTSVMYSSYFGGSGWESGVGIEYNNKINSVVLVGRTASSNFPTTPGVIYQNAPGGTTDGFAIKLNNASYVLEASTYIGTNANDAAMRIGFDCGNNIFIAGTTSGNYPVSNTAAQGLVPNGGIFITKFNPTLSTALASTRTATSSAIPTALIVDICGNILISTISSSNQSGMPLTPDAFHSAPRSFYFAAFGPNFTSLEFGSYFGNPNSTEHFHPAVGRMDPRGIVYQSVCATANTYPTTSWSYSPNKMNLSTNDLITFKFDFEAVGLDAVAESGYAGYGSIPHAVRGCKSAFINYSRNGDTAVPMVLRFNILPPTGNIATNGVDYAYISDSLYFAPYERTKSLEIKPLLVPNMPTGPKMVVIESLNPCGCDGAIGDPIRRDTVFILDSIRVGIDVPLPAYCPGTQITINGDVDAGLDFEWSPAEFNNGSLTINPILLTSRDYKITAFQPGAPSTCPPVTKVFHTLVEQYPVIHMPSDTVVCIKGNDSIAIPVMASPDSVNYLFNWSPGTGLRANNLQTNYFKMPPGTYHYAITATTPLANCSSTHNLKIDVRAPFKLSNVMPLSGTLVDYLDEVNVQADGAILYTWLPVEKYYDPTLQRATTKPITEPGDYLVTGVDKYGCRDTASIFLDVRYPYDPIMPNAFSPNNDGKNDVFAIPNAKFQKLLRFEVYNRWGKRVFHTTDVNKGWDGTDIDNGKLCAQAVYNYIVIIELPNKERKTYKGDVTLIR